MIVVYGVITLEVMSNLAERSKEGRWCGLL